ncbi:MAG: thermonuclease family protein [bacterium]|nr:thermonuclease family protein [bacterium]
MHIFTKTNVILLVLLVVVVGGVAYARTKNISPRDMLQALWNREEKPAKKDPNATPPEFGIVETVEDAITLVLDTGQRIRYVGVRSPNVSDTVQCFGREAVQANESIIGKKVRMETEPLLNKTSDGAFARYVYLQLTPEEISQSQAQPPAPETSESPSPTVTPDIPKEIFINERILEGGFAFPVVSPQTKYGERMLSAAKFASSTQKGLWGKCKVTNENNQLQTEADTQCLIKGKVTADLQKIYRTPECSAYKETTVLSSQGGKWFCAEDNATDAGFTKGSDCK